MNFDRLNSATKYPSILTYHKLGEKGRLLPETNVDFSGEELVVTEKVDGTNGRIVMLPGDDYFIGSREELLYAKGDRIGNPALGIVDALKPIADRLGGDQGDPVFTYIAVFYFEVYGHRQTPAWKNYGDGAVTGVRLFDAAEVPSEILQQDREEISRWRDNGGQKFGSERTLNDVSYATDVELTQRIVSTAIPSDLLETKEWLASTITKSYAMLGDGLGRPEGVVVRTKDRSKIAKIRFEDYKKVNP